MRRSGVGTNSMKRVVLFLCAVITLAGTAGLLPESARSQPATGNPGQSRFQPIVFVDLSQYRSESPDSSILECSYQLYNFGLPFEKQGSDYVAEYEIAVLVRDRRGDQVAADVKSRSAVVADADRIRSRFDFRTSQVRFTLPPDRYVVSFELRSKQGAVLAVREMKTELRDYSSALPKLSGVLLAQSIDSVAAGTSVFSKGGIQVIPSVVRAFGGDDTTQIRYYFELYGDPADSERLILETILRHASQGLVWRDTTHMSLVSPVSREVRSIPIRDLPAGAYMLELFLRGRRNKKIDERIEPFTILLSAEGMLRNEWKSMVQLLSYIAGGSEIRSMRELESPQERKEAFDQFWLKRDPTPGSPDNETKEEFYRRVQHANTHFTHARRDGWKTDRGRIYIIHGQPDFIDDQPYAPDRLPYQVWHYYSVGDYLQFRFVDENEDGDYRLQFPYDGRGQRPEF